MYYIYILFSESADKYYVGYSQFPNERLLKHNQQENFNTFTRKFRPWKMVALFEVSDDKTLAIKIEQYIKNQKSRKLLEKLCDESHQLSGILAQLIRVRNFGINQRVFRSCGTSRRSKKIYRNVGLFCF